MRRSAAYARQESAARTRGTDLGAALLGALDKVQCAIHSATHRYEFPLSPSPVPCRLPGRPARRSVNGPGSKTPPAPELPSFESPELRLKLTCWLAREDAVLLAEFDWPNFWRVGFYPTVGAGRDWVLRRRIRDFILSLAVKFIQCSS